MYTTEALILKKEGLGEADCLISALTPDFVRVQLVAQGVRKAGAKLKGHIEPFSLSRISFVAGRNNYRLVGAEAMNFFSTLRSDAFRLRAAAEIVTSLERALFEDRNDDSGNFFELAKEAFFVLDEPGRREGDFERVLVWFRIQFLRELGLFPDGATDDIPYLEGLKGAPAVSCAHFVEAFPPEDAERFGRAAAHLFGAYLPR